MTVTPGDRKVTLTWPAVPGAADYVVYYTTEDKTLDKSAASKDAGKETTLVVDGLINATHYKFAVEASNSAGASKLSDEIASTPKADTALGVATLTPTDAAIAVSRSPTFKVSFNRPVVPASVTVAVSNSSCGATTLQVSADDFTTCVQMADQPVISDNNQTYQVIPANPLQGSKLYKLRVTSGVTEPIGGVLDNPFNASFTTNAALALAQTAPPDGAAGVSLNPALQLTFNRPAFAASVTTNTGDTSCSGSVQLSRASDGFARCQQMSAVTAVGAEGTTWALHPASPLAGGTAYKLRVTTAALDLDQVGPVGPLLISFTTDVALGVAALLPADGEPAAPLNSSISVTFTKPAAPASITVNTADVSCSGSLQVSPDDFASCVQMAAAPATLDNKTFTVTPAALLPAARAFKIRVRTDATDADGVPLLSTFTSAAGFITKAGLQVSSTSPIDNTTAVPINAAIAVTFNRPVSPATLTASTAGTACTGSLQLSADGFATCVAFTAAPAAAAGNTSFVLTPAALLSPSSLYRLRVTTAALDADGVPLPVAFTSAHGFTTDTAPAVVSTAPASGTANVALNASFVVTLNHAMDPTSLTANTADTACSGSVQLSGDGFVTCARLSAQPVASAANHAFAVQAALPLAAQTAYTLRLKTSAHDSAGVPLPADVDAIAFTTVAALAVATTTPADGDTNLALNPSISVSFNRTAQVQSVTVNTADTQCSGSLQLSRAADNFAAGTCVAMAAQPASSDTDRTFTVSPAGPLQENTFYKIRVTTGARDGDGVALLAPFTLVSGFKTGPALAVTATSPASAATLVPLNAPIVVTFNKPAQVSSITANTTGTTCTGAVQLSTDGFATCVKMAASPAPSSNNTVFTAQPAAALASSAPYKIRVTTAARDATGVALAQDFTLASAFTTNAAIAVASTTPTGVQVPVNTSLSLTFSRAAQPASITANVSGTACSGSVQLSSDGFATCVRMVAQPSASPDGTNYSLTPAGSLLASTLYRLRVTTGARDADGVPLAAAFTSAGFTTDSSLGIFATTPIDGQTGVALNSTISIQFNKQVDAGSISTNTADTSCSGTLQLSRSGDNFATCVRMSGAPQTSDGGSTWVLLPAAPLEGSATYRLRVTTGVRDTALVPLPANYDSPIGFTTDLALAVLATSPANGQSGVPLNASISVSFNKAAAGVTSNVGGTACSGSLQLSIDGFITCVAMTAQPLATAGGTVFTVTPAKTLDGATPYAIRVTSAAHDLAGVPLSPAFTTPDGFLTDAALEVTGTTPADGATSVALNSTVAVTFNKPADAATITATQSGTACGTSTLQLSSDNFATCVAMNGQPAASPDGRTFTMTPATFLAANAQLRIRVTTGAHDPAGVPLLAQYQSPSGFHTDNALAVSSVAPTGTSVPRNAVVVVTFNKPVAPASVTAITSGSTCAGFSVQLSANSFAACVPMAAAPVASSNNTVFTLTPLAFLTGGGVFQVRVTQGVTDAANVPLAAVFNSATFTVQPALTVSAITPADGATHVALNSAVQLDFNKALQPGSVTTNTTDTSCSGTFQVSTDGFNTCVKMSGQPVASLGNTRFTVASASALQPNTLYRTRLTVGALDAAGVPLSSTYVSAGFTSDVALTVATAPADGATTVQLNTPVTITFNRAVGPSTVTTNFADTTCSGTLQLSRAADNFSVCVRMTAAPAVQGGGNTAFLVQPLAPLAASTTYKIRVTSAVQDAAGVPLSSTFTSVNGFTTDVGLAVQSTTPADGATGIARNTQVTVRFNKTAQLGATPVNTADTACTGTLQLSADSFQTCVKMTSATTSDNLTFVLTPAAPLNGAANYKLKVTTAAKDSAGVALLNDSVSLNGFTTSPALAVASTTPANNATLVARNTSVSITFNRAALISSATIDTAPGVCSGSLQIKIAGGACVQPLSVTPSGGNGTSAPTFTLALPVLAGDTQYQLITGAPLADSDGVALTAPVTVGTFRTNLALAVASTSPANAAASVPPNVSISVTFNRAPDPASFSGVATSNCSTGGIQVSTGIAFTRPKSGAPPTGTCIPMQGPAVSSNNGLTWTVKPAASLNPATQYFIRVNAAVTDADGVALGTAIVTPQGFTTNNAFIVNTSAPANNATTVARNTAVSVTFNFPANPATVDGNTTDTSCSTGAIQLSRAVDDFAGSTCVQLAAQPVTADNKTFTVQPLAPLQGATAYKIRVTQAAQDTNGVALFAEFRTPNGFTTNASLAASAFAPTGTSVARNATLSVTFNRDARASSVTGSTSGTACSGTFQVSSDGFNTCVALAAQPITSDNRTFTATSALPLAGNTPFRLRVKDTVQDSDGVALGLDATSGTFTTIDDLTVSSFTPADSASPVVPRNTAVSVTFSRAPRATSITTNTADASCSGSIQLSRQADNFTACVRMAAQPTGGGVTWTVTPLAALDPATAYQIRVTSAALDGSGVGADVFTSNGFTTKAAMAVSSITPSAGASQIPLNTAVVVTFSRAATPGSVTINTASTSCSGAVQLSSDSQFTSCVKLGSITPDGTNTVFTVRAAADLASQTGYFVRVGPPAADSDGVALSSATTTASPFTTKTAMTVASTSPASGATAVPVNSGLSVTFTRAAAPATITASTSGTACTGAVQLSADSFAHCVPMTSSPGAANGAQTVFSFTPAAQLAGATQYRLRVTTAALDGDGAQLPAQFDLAAPFTTDTVPQLSSATPADGAFNVALNQPVVLQFNKPVKLSSVTAPTDCSGSVQITAAGGGCAPVSISANGAGDQITLTPTPTSPLLAATVYKLKVTAGVTDQANVPLSNPLTQATGFATKAALTVSASPVNGASGVALNAPIIVSFSRAVQAATVTTLNSSACTANVFVSIVGSGTCVPIASVAQAGNVFTLTPAGLLPSGANLTVNVRTSVLDSDGVPLQSPFTQAAGFFVNSRLSVTSNPADGQAGVVARNSAIQLIFNRTPDTNPATFLTNTGTACSGSIQLSSTGFTTCVPMTSTVPALVSGSTFALQPAQPLAGDTVFQIRVTTAVADPDGVSLGAQYDTPAGFRTQKQIGVFTTSPADSGVVVSRTLSSISVSFNIAALPGSVTSNNGAASCSGSFQVLDGATCLPVTAVSAQPGNLTFSVSPVSLLPGSHNFKVKLSGVRDADGVTMPDYVMSTGFNSKPELLVQSATPSGNAVAINAATVVTFTRAASNVVATATSDCTGGSLYLLDSGGACVPASVTSPDGVAFTLQPLANLGPAADYRIHVTSGVTDSDGTPLAADFEQPFHTQPTLAVTAVLPADLAVDQPLNSVIQLDFNKAPNAATLTVNGPGDTTCSGRLQVSSDAFASCVPMTAALAASLSGTSFKLTPQATLAPSTTYRVKVQQTVSDPSGFGMSADFVTATGFATKIPFTPSVAPADGAQNVARNTAVDVTFSRAAKATTVTVSNAGSACSGSVQISATSFGSCLPVFSSVTTDNLTWHLVLAAPLPGSQTIRVRVKGSVQDVDGVALVNDFSSAGFNTSPAMTVAVTPANNATNLSLSAALQLTFNTAPADATVTAASAACTDGGVALSTSSSFAAGSCVALSRSSAGSTYTFTPVALLQGNTTYFVQVTSAVHDFFGVPLEGTYSGRFTTATPPVDVSNLNIAGVNLQSAPLTWTISDSHFDHANIYASPIGQNTFSLVGTGTSTGGTASGLQPFHTYNLRVKSSDAAGNESSGQDTVLSTNFSGTPADFLAAQAVTGVSGNKFRLTWSDSDIVAAVSTAADGNLLTNDQDALWVAIDTDPSGSDTNGEWRTTTNSTAATCTSATGPCEVIWPFKADWILELKPSAGVSQVNIRNVATNTWSNQPGGIQPFNGALDELRVPRTLIGSPTRMRFALAAINTSNGFTYGLAPKSSTATDVTGLFASLTSSLNAGTNVFDPAKLATSLDPTVSPQVAAASLVTISGDGSTAPIGFIDGNLHPLSYTSSDVSYTLTSVGNVSTGVFNFGAATGELFFKLVRSGTAEFTSGTDRVFTLSGATQAIPQLLYGTAYSATHSFSIGFVVTSGGSPVEIVGSVAELGNFTLGAGAQLQGTNPYSVTVPMSNHDFTGGSPLRAKIGYNTAGTRSFEGSPSDHIMNDDVINTRQLSWSAGSNTGEPF